MKYLLKVLIILLIIFGSLKLVIHLFNDGHKISYSVGNFEVDETLETKALYNTDYYYFNIIHEDFKMNFSVPVNYNKAEKIISSIKYQNIDGMNCIMPVFKGGKLLTDIMCVKNSNITFYHDLSDNYKNNLNKFVKSLEKYNYNPSIYEDKAEARSLSNSEKIYDDNIMQNHYLAIENYKGLSLLGNKENSVKLFENDKYTKAAKMFYDKYYIVADYEQEYSFKNFYVVNIINGNVKKIRSYDDISFDLVMEGAVKDDIYFFDKDSETQYKISLKYETIEKTGDKNSIKYYNGKWETMTLNEALDGKTFDKYYMDVPSGFVKADCLDKYCYFYKKQGDSYMVYRADRQNYKLKTYLFTTTNLQSVIYLDRYIYFINGNYIYYYSDNGVRRVFENTELEFNDNILFGAYIR